MIGDTKAEFGKAIAVLEEVRAPGSHQGGHRDPAPAGAPFH
jgi:hypothetical protein